MNFSLKPHPLIAHWVPGMVVLMPLVFSHFHWGYEKFVNDLADSTSAAALSILLLSVAAFLIGEVLDSARDSFIEIGLDWFGRTWPRAEKEDYPILRYLRPIELNWSYFSTLTPEKAQVFDDYYWTYYVLNMNLALALLLSMILNLLGCVTVPEGYSFWFWLVAILSFFILLCDALVLRHEAGLRVMK